MDLSNIIEKIKLLFSELWPVIWPLLKTILTTNGKMALEAAKRIVVNIQETMPNATGQEKASAALTQLMEVLSVQGIAMGAEMLRTIIKIAYEHMMAEPQVIEEAKAIQEALIVATPHPGVEP